MARVMKHQGPCTLASMKRVMLESTGYLEKTFKAFLQEIFNSYISGQWLSDGDTVLKNSNFISIMAKLIGQQNECNYFFTTDLITSYNNSVF